MSLLFYSMSWDAVVAYDLIEDPTLTVPMKLTSNGILYVKGQYIEETKSYPGFIPAPIGTMSFDTFDYYTAPFSIQDLNSGSNEWNGTTYLARWFGREAFEGIKEYDMFDNYTIGATIGGLIGGVGLWSGSYSWNSRAGWQGIRYVDVMDNYITKSSVTGLSGSLYYNSTVWTHSYVGRTIYYGVVALDLMNVYQTGSSFTGSNLSSDSRYNGFISPWVTRPYVSSSL